jgi:protein involved in polysaccharide export with SLBB domain
MKRILWLCASGYLTLLIAGCTNTKPRASSFNTFTPSGTNATVLTLTNSLDPALLHPSANLFTLGPGDQLEIEIIGNPASRALTAVGPDGKLYYHLLPGIDVWGLTLAETQDLLESGLGKYLNQPHVALTLRTVASKHVWLLGRLSKPGIYPMTGPMTLLESLALAGGSARNTLQLATEELADLRHSFVMRKGQLVPVDFYRLLRQGDMSQNIYLEPDDFVYVPSSVSQQVYVLGAVKFPRAVPYSEGMTLISAISGATGPLKVDWLATTYTGLAPDAYMSHIAVVRGSLAQPQLSVIDANAIIKGSQPDFPIEPGDIIYVPNVPYAMFKRYFNTIVTTFISTVAANAGTSAGGQQTVGVSVPVGVR